MFKMFAHRGIRMSVSAEKCSEWATVLLKYVVMLWFVLYLVLFFLQFCFTSKNFPTIGARYGDLAREWTVNYLRK